MCLNGTLVSLQNSRHRTVWTTLPAASAEQAEMIESLRIVLMRPTTRSPTDPIDCPLSVVRQHWRDTRRIEERLMLPRRYSVARI